MLGMLVIRKKTACAAVKLDHIINLNYFRAVPRGIPFTCVWKSKTSRCNLNTYINQNKDFFCLFFPSSHKSAYSQERRSFTHMFLFLFLSSLSMMKCCVLSGGSTIRLGIVLLSPNTQAPGPGHAAAERHLGGFPLRCCFLYHILLLQTGGCWDTSAAQPRLKRKHPFLLLLLLFLLSSYLTVRNNT